MKKKNIAIILSGGIGKRFKDAKISIVGDDMRSQVGASIISAVLQEMFQNRGADVQMHYQDNIGGNTDFLNMQDTSRITSKKISKENVIKEQIKLAGKEVLEHSVAAGPAQYFPALRDNKRAHWLIKAIGFGGAPIEFTADLSVQDSPNSAGVVIDALRLCKVANEMKIYGPLIGPSAWTQKTPPKPKLWPKGEKEFWYAKYFLSMALNPNVQAHLTPKQVFEVVRCTVDGFEVDYEYKKFVDEIGDKQILPPHISKYVYDLSFNCSVKVRLEHEKAMREKIEKEAAIPLEQSI